MVPQLSRMLKLCTFRFGNLTIPNLRKAAFCTSLESKIPKLKNARTAAAAVSKKRTYLYEACRAVVNNEISVEELQKDSQFIYVCDEIIEDIKEDKEYSKSAKIKMLQSLLFMNLDPETKVVQYLENELLWETKNLTVEEIIECLSFHILHRKSDLQKRVLEELSKACHCNFNEVSRNKNLLLKCWKFYDPCVIGDELARKIEEETLRIFDHSSDPIDAKILLNIIIAFSQSKRRNLSILKKISETLDEKMLKDVTDVDLIISVISSLSKLNFPDITLLNKLTIPLSNAKIITVKPSALSALLKSMGQMNWKCIPFLDEFISNVDKLNMKIRPQVLISFVLTSAKLNYNPPEMRQCLEDHVFPNITEKSITDKKVWLDYVWSLAILGYLSVDHIRSVFKSSFYENVLDVDATEQTFIKLKLLNIKAVANLEMDAIFESPEGIENIVQPLRSADVNRLNNIIINDLNSFLPCDKFMFTDVKSPIGAIINAQFVVNRDLKPIRLSKQEEESVDMNTIPKGYKRVNLLVFHFKDRILGGNELIGVHNLVIRLLKKLDDNVVVIDDTIYNLKATAVQRITCIRDLIKNSF